MGQHNSPGAKRRRAAKRERDRLSYAARIAELRAAGASCGNCTAFKKDPTGMTGHICTTHSDFHGYSVAKSDGICDLHHRAGAPAQEDQIRG